MLCNVLKSSGVVEMPPLGCAPVYKFAITSEVKLRNLSLVMSLFLINSLRLQHSLRILAL